MTAPFKPAPFRSALNTIPEEPCASCPFKYSCNSLSEACETFEEYIEGNPDIGLLRYPSREIYNRVFCDKVPYQEVIHGY